MPARNESCATYFGYYCLERSNFCSSFYSSSEGTCSPQDTFNDDLLTVFDLAFGMMQSQTGRDSRTRWRAIDLCSGEDANVAAMVSRVLGRTGENRAIQKT